MECPPSSASANSLSSPSSLSPASLIPCKFCYKKSFDSQSRLCEHEVEEHGYVRPCTVTTPKITPSIIPTAPKMDGHPLDVSDPRSTAALWAKWTQENEKLFREFVLNIKTTKSINLPESFSPSSYYLDFVPDYSSPEFPTSLSFLSSGSPVLVEADPVVESAVIPSPVEIQTVPVIYSGDDGVLQAVEISASAASSGIRGDPVLCTTQDSVFRAEDDEDSEVNDLNANSNLANEEVILIPAAVDPTYVNESTVLQASDIVAPSQELVGSDIIVGEGPSVPLELPSSQVVLDECVLDEVTGQLILPNNAVLDPTSVTTAPGVSPIIGETFVTDPPLLDETTGEFIATGSSIPALSTVVVNQEGNLVAVPVLPVIPVGTVAANAGVSLAPDQNQSPPSDDDVVSSNEESVVDNSGSSSCPISEHIPPTQEQSPCMQIEEDAVQGAESCNTDEDVLIPEEDVSEDFSTNNLNASNVPVPEDVFEECDTNNLSASNETVGGDIAEESSTANLNTSNETLEDEVAEEASIDNVNSSNETLEDELAEESSIDNVNSSNPTVQEERTDELNEDTTMSDNSACESRLNEVVEHEADKEESEELEAVPTCTTDQMDLSDVTKTESERTHRRTRHSLSEGASKKDSPTETIRRASPRKAKTRDQHSTTEKQTARQLRSKALSSLILNKPNNIKSVATKYNSNAEKKQSSPSKSSSSPGEIKSQEMRKRTGHTSIAKSSSSSNSKKPQKMTETSRTLRSAAIKTRSRHQKLNNR